jgi:hypothetical protein
VKIAYTIASYIYGGVAVCGFLIWFNGDPGSRHALVAGVACLVASIASANAAESEGAK